MLKESGEDFSLSSMATVVDLSKSNSYLSQVYLCGACLVWHVYLMVKCALMMSLFVWSMSGASRAFGKTCTRDELIRVVHHI